MTENQIERRYTILEKTIQGKRNNYNIKLDNSFISIRNIHTLEGIYTDSLQAAKRWIARDMKL